MKPSRHQRWQNGTAQYLEELLTSEVFVAELTAAGALDRKNMQGINWGQWLALKRAYRLPVSAMLVLSDWLETGKVDQTHLVEPALHVYDRTNETYDGWPLDIFTSIKPMATQKVWLEIDEDTNLTQAIKWLRDNWASRIEPGQERVRGGRRRQARYKPMKKRNDEIIRLAEEEGLKPASIALRIAGGISAPEISNILYRHRKGKIS